MRILAIAAGLLMSATVFAGSKDSPVPIRFDKYQFQQAEEYMADGQAQLIYGRNYSNPDHGYPTYRLVGLNRNPDYGKSAAELYDEGHSLKEIARIDTKSKYLRTKLEPWVALTDVRTLGLSVTLTIGEVYSNIDVIGLEGHRLSDLCGQYSGRSVGAALFLGERSFHIKNGPGIVLESNLIEAGGSVDLSRMTAHLRCDKPGAPWWNQRVAR